MEKQSAGTESHESCHPHSLGETHSYCNSTPIYINKGVFINAVNMSYLITLQLAELSNPAPQASSVGFDSSTATGFGSSTSSFGNKGEDKVLLLCMSRSERQ